MNLNECSVVSFGANHAYQIHEVLLYMKHADGLTHIRDLNTQQQFSRTGL